MRQVIAVILFGIFPFLTGCVTNIPHPTSMNFDAQSMIYVGPVHAKTGQGFLFCAIPLNERYDLSTVLNSAVHEVGADAAINVLAETESGVVGIDSLHLGIYCWNETRISGVAVRFKPSVKLGLSGEMPQ